MELKHDLHMHTYLSACCPEKEGHRPAAILARAEEMGVRTMGFADHVWVNDNLTPSAWYAGQGAGQMARLREDLRDVPTGVRCLVGCEAETIAPGRFGMTPEFAATIDFVLLSCSHFHMTDFVAQPARRSPRGLADHMLEFFRSAVASGLATSIPHPLLPMGHMELYDAAIASISDAELLDAFGLAAENGVALEITTSFLPDFAGGLNVETPLRYLSLAKKAGCWFTLGTDAHKPEAQERLPELARITETMGLTQDDLPALVRDGV